MYKSLCRQGIMLQSEEKKWRTKTDSQAVSGMHPLLQEWSSGTGGAGIRRELRGAPGAPFWPWHSPGRTYRVRFLTSGARLWLLQFPHSLRDTRVTSCLHPDIRSLFLVQKQQMKKTPAALIKSSPDGSPGNVALEEGAQPSWLRYWDLACHVFRQGCPFPGRKSHALLSQNHMRKEEDRALQTERDLGKQLRKRGKKQMWNRDRCPVYNKRWEADTVLGTVLSTRGYKQF